MGPNESNYRVVPENEHCLLFMEASSDLRTFKDYPNMAVCFGCLDDMFNSERVRRGFPEESHDIDDLKKWIDEFHKIEMMVYDKELGRYLRIDRETIKEKLEDMVRKAVCSAPSNGVAPEKSTSNGYQSSAESDDLIWDE